jgi:type I restriction enzyme R subunit
VYTIETKITKQGETIEAGYQVQIQDLQTRAKRWEKLDDDIIYQGKQLDRDVVTPDQIRKILETFKNKALPEVFPDREWIPKTLIFAKDDNHAENIVDIARKVFNEGNEAVQKITYKTTGKKPEDLIKAFRTSPMPRIAVTVDMIATGTDIKAVEIVFFMRAVQSRSFFEQMKGRGVRVIKTEDLQAVTPDAPCKELFVIVDAVGVCAAAKTDSYTFEQQRNVSIEKLLQQIGLGSIETKALTTLAGRLARLEHRITGKEDQQLKQITNGLDLKALSRQLIDAVNPDNHLAQAQQQTGLENPDNQTLEQCAENLKHEAGKPFSNPKLRDFIAKLSNQTKQIIIDTISVDEVISAGISQTATQKAQITIDTFENYLTTHKNEITALQILFNRPYSQRLDLNAIKELAEQIEKPPYHLTKDNVWKAYATLGKSTDTAKTERLLTDLISLCRFAAHQDNELIPFANYVQTNFNSWLAGQRNQGIEFTEKQIFWLEKIRDHITGSLSMDTNAFDYGVFAQAGGLGAFYDSFGDDYEQVIEQLNTALVA